MKIHLYVKYSKSRCTNVSIKCFKYFVLYTEVKLGAFACSKNVYKFR